MFSFREEISSIEEITEITPDGTNNKGNLVLSDYVENIKLTWNIIDDKFWFRPIEIEHKTQITHNWDEYKSFTMEISNINLISFLQNPLRIQIQVDKSKIKREFLISDLNIGQFLSFVESLIINCIALPTNKHKYSLEIYKRCYKGLFVVQPYNLHIDYDEDIDKLFNNICKYASDVLNFYDKQNSLPKDPGFPLTSMALCNVQQFNEQYRKSEKMQKIEKEEWPSFFDEEGKFINYKEVKERCKFAGIDHSLIPDLLLFITGVFSPDSTYKERETLKQKLIIEYNCLKKQSQTLTDDLLANNQLIRQYATTIRKDVNRTDRNLKCFINQDGEGLKILTDLLNCYLLNTPDILYLQGMNDIIVPILTAFIPEWDDQSNPICDNLDEKLALVFWCYTGLLHILNHEFLLKDVTYSEYISHHALSYIGNVSPALKIWYFSQNLTTLTFAFSEYIYLYKRTFDDIWRIWIYFLCFDKPEYSLAIFTASIFISSYPQILTFKNWKEATMNVQFPKLLKTLDVQELLFISSKIYDPNIIAPYEKMKCHQQTSKTQDNEQDNHELRFLKFADSITSS